MTPGNAMDSITHGHLVQAELSAHLGDGRGVLVKALPERHHQGFIQSGIGMVHTTAIPALQSHIAIVLSASTWPEMVRSNATAHIATVTEGRTIRDWPISDGPRNTVSEEWPPSVAAMLTAINDSVAFEVEATHPDPASGRLDDMVPESLDEFGGKILLHRDCPLDVMPPDVCPSRGCSTYCIGVGF